MATPTVYTPKALIDPVQLGTVTSTLYASPAGQDGTQLTAIIVVNDTTTADEITLHLVPSGGSAGDDNVLCKDMTIAGDGVPVNVLGMMGVEQLFLEAGGTLQGKADVAGQFTVHLSGVELD